jgi:FkbM family methyltransferase
MGVLNTLHFVLEHPLNRGHRLRACLRYLKWQAGSRLVPGPIIIDWIADSRIMVSPGETALTGSVYCGLHEFEDMAYVLHASDADDLFADVGANVGPYTILACAVRGARGFCFEPVPSTYRRLLDNIHLNNLSDRVQAFNIGLSDCEADLLFTTGENCTNHVVAEDEAAADAIRVRVRPLDRVLDREIPSILKIDVEGFETLVIKGASRTLRHERLHSVIIELNGSGSRYGFDEDEIRRTMRDHGFRAFKYEPFMRRLIPLEAGDDTRDNALFIRKEQAILGKIRSAPRLRVGNAWL